MEGNEININYPETAFPAVPSTQGPQGGAKTWSVDEVLSWIQSFGDEYAKTAEKFKQAGVTGAILLGITKHDIKSGARYPVKKAFRRSKMIDMLKQLKREEGLSMGDLLSMGDERSVSTAEDEVDGQAQSPWTDNASDERGSKTKPPIANKHSLKINMDVIDIDALLPPGLSDSEVESPRSRVETLRSATSTTTNFKKGDRVVIPNSRRIAKSGSRRDLKSPRGAKDKKKKGHRRVNSRSDLWSSSGSAFKSTDYSTGTVQVVMKASGKVIVKLDDGTRQTFLASELVPANPNDQANNDDTNTIRLTFSPGPVGITFTGNMVKSVTKGSTSDYFDVARGWRILKIDGKLMPNDTLQIQQELQSMKAQGTNYTIEFDRSTTSTKSGDSEETKSFIRSTETLVSVSSAMDFSEFATTHDYRHDPTRRQKGAASYRRRGRETHDVQQHYTINVAIRPFGFQYQKGTTLIHTIHRNGPADKAGVAPGSNIVSINGKAVNPKTWFSQFKATPLPFQQVFYYSCQKKETINIVNVVSRPRRSSSGGCAIM